MAGEHDNEARTALVVSGALVGAAVGGLPGAVLGSFIGYVASGTRHRL